MSLCSLIIAKQPIAMIGKDRYHKHTLIYENSQDAIYIYSRMANVLSPSQTVLMSYYQFLLSINQISPIFIVIDELLHQQSELDLAINKIALLNAQSKMALTQETPIEYGKIYFIS